MEQKATLLRTKAELKVLAEKEGVSAETAAQLAEDVAAIDTAIASVSEGGELYNSTIKNIADTESNITDEKKEQLDRTSKAALETIRNQTALLKLSLIHI